MPPGRGPGDRALPSRDVRQEGWRRRPAVKVQTGCRAPWIRAEALLPARALRLGLRVGRPWEEQALPSGLLAPSSREEPASPSAGPPAPRSAATSFPARFVEPSGAADSASP